MRRHAAVLVVVTLGLAACGGDDDESGSDSTTATTEASGGGNEGSAPYSEYVDALTASFLDDTDGEPLTADEDEARCTAERVVRDVGRDRLEEAGLTIEALGEPDVGDDGLDLTDEEAGAMADAVLDCIDVGREFAASIGGDEIDPAAAECMAEALASERAALRSMFVGTFIGGDGYEPSVDEAGVMVDALLECASFGEMVAAGAAEDGIEFTDEEIACLDDAARRDGVIRDSIIAQVTGDSDTLDEDDFGAAIAECLPGLGA